MKPHKRGGAHHKAHRIEAKHLMQSWLKKHRKDIETRQIGHKNAAKIIETIIAEL